MRETGYADAGELVVANADYIVNAVGLKLAVGDVSPQAPQVLLMMMRLCGPSLLPYLDDLAGSIFDALERYHGYTKLTELLFSVLKGMTEEGVKTRLLAITQSDTEGTVPHHQKFLTMADVISAVKKLNDNAARRQEEDEQISNDPFPHEPWKKDIPKEHSSQGEDEPENEDTRSSPPSDDDPKPPAPATFSLLLRISSLTQHYLTTPSPSLRISLLSLLRTTIPALAKHENSFLPLINTLWPVLLPRLEDPEAYVVSNALDIVALMCEYAGGFMRTRIEECWGVLGRVYKRTQQRERSHPSRSNGLKTIETGMSSLDITSTSTSSYRPELYIDAPSRMIRNSLVNLMCKIAAHVTIRDERFEETLGMLEPELEREDVRRSLERCNADAVWLRMHKKERASIGREGVGKVPVGRSEWKFVKI